MNSYKYLFFLLLGFFQHSFSCSPPKVKNSPLPAYGYVQKDYATEFPGVCYNPYSYREQEEQKVSIAAGDSEPAVEKEPTPPQSARSSVRGISKIEITITTSSGNATREVLKQLIPLFPVDE